MEPHEIIAALRRRLLWVVAAIGLSILVALSTEWHVSPSGIQKRTRAAAVAQAEFLVDSEDSSLVNLTQETEPLTTRAEIYAQYMRSNGVRLAIAKGAGIAPDLIVVDSPTTAAGGTQNIPRPGPARAAEIRGEERRYRIAFTAQPELPVVTIVGQAPTPVEAIDLVTAAVETFARYINRIEVKRQKPKAEPARIVPLGSTVAGVINGRADLAVAVLAFLVAVASSCLAIVGGDALAARRATGIARDGDGMGPPERRYERLTRALAELDAWQARASTGVLDEPRVPRESIRRGKRSHPAR